MARVKLETGPGIFAVLANVCRNPQEALKQFVENAADAIDQAHTEEGYIRLKLEYEPEDNGHKPGTLRRLVIEDNGGGITRDKMSQILQRIGDSEKINLALRGEQGIGILAFALVAQELHLASTAEEGSPSSCLVLKRSWLKRGYAEVIEHCSVHEHTHRGTIAYLDGILPEIASQLSKERIKAYLGQQFANDLRANLYSLSISDDTEFEEIYSQRFRGVKVMSASLSLMHGVPALIDLYVLPWEIPDATISLYGRRGTRICSLTDLSDFKVMPWLDQRLEGSIRCDRLKRSADKTAVVQDEVYRALVTALQPLEPKIQQLILDVSAESQARRFNVILQRAGKLIDKFLRYREKGLLEQLPLATATAPDMRGGVTEAPPLPRQPAPGGGLEPATPTMRTSTHPPYISLQSPPQDKADYRSWYDPGQGVICLNREHAEFLLSQREDRRCLRYLFSIWAKESLLQEYGVNAEKVADELVGVLAEAEPLLW